MIPRLHELEPTRRLYVDFARELRAQGFSGDVELSAASRLVVATDNSVYQLLPEAVVFPRLTEDVALLLRLAAEPRFREVTLAPRGGGTGTNGQSLSTGVIVDMSRHMARLLELNLAEGWVRVQPGIVLDELNAALRPHGVFFAPSLSPSNRATLGGMVSTDASGEGSRVWGKTSQSVLDLTTVLMGGVTFTAAPLDAAGLARMEARDDVVGRLHRVVDEIVTAKAALIDRVFPKLQRFMTGYNLAMVRSGERFDLCALLCGSEGTLGVVTEMRLRIVPRPKHKRLVVLKFASFDDALASAELVVRSDPSAIETVDETVIGLARGDVIWHRVRDILDEPPGLRAVNLVEYLGDDAAAVDARARSLCDAVAIGQPGQPLGFHVCATAGEADAMWTLRKKGVGLLGNAPGARKPIPFIEDTCVPPERLRAYIAELRALLDAEGLQYGMFGHIDVGCLHVRPALDMKDPADETLLRRLSDRVVDLVQHYGGVIWGEHGKGLRSEYNPRFFGDELFGDLCRIKGAFDPTNQLNPGKIAFPAGSGAALTTIDAPKRGAFDRQIPPPVRQHFTLAIDCNGNGQCFDWDPDKVMCPSSKATRDRIHSPKGRAGVLREWLRQLAAAGYDPLAPRRSNVIARAWSTARRRYDYSNEVYGAMAGCLACKACATQCPIKVDVPTLRADFLELYHSRYLRPLRDHLVAGLESMAAAMSRAPRLMNALMGLAPIRWLIARLGGIVDNPRLSHPTARAGLAARNLRPLDAERTDKTVLLLPDAFTSFYEAPVMLATVDLLGALGFDVRVLPYRQSGKGLHIKGFLRRFKKVAERNAVELRQAAALGVPIVGLDPAVVLVHRDEVPHALGVRDPGYRVHLLQEWLVTCDLPRVPSGADYTLLGHCTERTAEPGSQAAWRTVFEAMGLRLELADVGCCGMCGVFGHEREHRSESTGIFEASWAPRVPSDATARERVLADGHSCRSQVERLTGHLLRHPAQALLAELNP